jgi:RHS repeat-associated protein
MSAVLASPCRIKRNHRRRRTIASGRRDYNYLRDYDPATGRYLESDPSGVSAGVATYSYVLGNPIDLIDPKGKNWAIIAVPVVFTCVVLYCEIHMSNWCKHKNPNYQYPDDPDRNKYLTCISGITHYCTLGVFGAEPVSGAAQEAGGAAGGK